MGGREGSYVFETPGEVHTLTVDDDDEMQTFFYVGGPTLYVDEQRPGHGRRGQLPAHRARSRALRQGRPGRRLREPVHPLTAEWNGRRDGSPCARPAAGHDGPRHGGHRRPRPRRCAERLAGSGADGAAARPRRRAARRPTAADPRAHGLRPAAHPRRGPGLAGAGARARGTRSRPRSPSCTCWSPTPASAPASRTAERASSAATGTSCASPSTTSPASTLTLRLLPLLRRSAPARVVLVASAGQQPIDFDDVMLRARLRGLARLPAGKLAQVMFGFDLAERRGGRRRHRHEPASRDVHADEDRHRGRARRRSTRWSTGSPRPSAWPSARTSRASRAATTSALLEGAPTRRPTTRRRAGGCGTSASR